MNTSAQVRSSFPNSAFGPPVSAQVISEVEAELGHELPQVLRDLYLNFDGFMGPLNTPFLFPLRERPTEMQESLLSFTRFLRDEDYCPPWLHRAVAVGGDGGGSAWFVLLETPDCVVRWEAEWGPEYEQLEGSLLDVWLSKKSVFESLLPRDA